MDELTRRRRLEIARKGLQGYEEWLHSEDPSKPIDPEALGDLVTATRWLIEDYSGDET